MIGILRMVIRLLVIFIWTLVAMLIQSVMLLMPGRGREKFAQFYWRGVGYCLGLKVTIHGKVAEHRPALFIANHCSWLDIVALGAALPGCFVAKSEIIRWPFVNWVAKLGRTVFVSRSRTSVGRERAELNRRLDAGDNIILFPEGTTSDGARVLPFSSAFLSLADAPARPCVQPVTVVYDRLDGLPVQYRNRAVISWYGDMDMVSHYNRIGRRATVHATMILDEPIAPGMFPNRKELAAALEARLAHNAAALRQGRAVV
jgi:1-acyl-sn-glycerol-3-phosphate acyltransferase